MKKVVLFILVVAFPTFIMAQNSAVDKLFAKYKGKQGVTTVSVSPELFQMINAMGIEELEEQDFPMDKIASVKILTIEDEEGYEDVNFYNEIKKDLDVSDFAEVMTVDDGGEVVRMWMKVDKKTVSEFLLIVGGDDNVLIYITGNFNIVAQTKVHHFCFINVKYVICKISEAKKNLIFIVRNSNHRPFKTRV